MSDDEADDIEIEEDGDDEGSTPTAAGKNYITPKGLAVIKAELHELLTIERPKTVEVVAWAAGNGDRSENADYQYGKRRLREIDRRIRQLQKKLDAAVVVDPKTQSSESVLFGATVTVKNEDGEEKVYAIVGVDEADAKQNRISWISPLAQVLLQAKVGDFVFFRSPKAEEELEIVAIEYKAID